MSYRVRIGIPHKIKVPLGAPNQGPPIKRSQGPWSLLKGRPYQKIRLPNQRASSPPSLNKKVFLPFL